MPKPSRRISQLKLVAQITPHVEIEDVRLLRLSARVYGNGETDTGRKVRLRLSTASQCKQVGTKLSAEVRFGMGGVQEQDVTKRVVDVSAVLELSYRLSKEVELTPQQLRAFGKVNALYNAWPYWRELVQTTVARLGLPRLVVPVFRVARPRIEQARSNERADSGASPRKNEPGNISSWKRRYLVPQKA